MTDFQKKTEQARLFLKSGDLQRICRMSNVAAGTVYAAWRARDYKLLQPKQQRAYDAFVSVVESNLAAADNIQRRIEHIAQ